MASSGYQPHGPADGPLGPPPNMGSGGRQIVGRAAPTVTDPRLLRQAFTPAESARILGVARSTVWRWIAAGHLQLIEAGPRRLVTLASIRQMMGCQPTPSQN